MKKIYARTAYALLLLITLSLLAVALGLALLGLICNMIAQAFVNISKALKVVVESCESASNELKEGLEHLSIRFRGGNQ